MQKVIMSLALGTLMFCGFASWAATDVYKLKMNVKVPRVYDNTSSKGYRKYQNQTLVGELRITYPEKEMLRPEISIDNLVNKTHKISGAKITYEVKLDEKVYPRINLLGSNKTRKFKTPSVIFAIECLPSYAISAPTEDNSLYLTLSGTGRIAKNKGGRVQRIKTLKGSLAGQQGCSCSAYGHLSPTRVNGFYGPWLDWVDDVAAAWGTWKATYLRTED